VREQFGPAPAGVRLTCGALVLAILKKMALQASLESKEGSGGAFTSGIEVYLDEDMDYRQWRITKDEEVFAEGTI
jgi:hypothetical protein